MSSGRMAENPRYSKFLFIVGCGRSGTTLLVSMLDSHPQLAIPGESDFIIPVCRKLATVSDPDALIPMFLTEMAASERFSLWGVERDVLKSSLEELRPTSVAQAVRCVYGQYAKLHGKSLYGDKYPEHVLVMDELAELFPESVFIHLIRDPRNTSLALFDAPFGPRSLDAAADYWKIRINAGRSSGRSLGGERYFEVFYEQLVAEPAEALKGVAGFLGIPFDEGQVDFGSAAERQLAMSPDPESDASLALPLTVNIRSWRKDMSLVDAYVNSAIVEPLTFQLGYPRSEAIHGKARRQAELRLANYRVRMAKRVMRGLGVRVFRHFPQEFQSYVDRKRGAVSSV
jgi:Sulfotransferase family